MQQATVRCHLIVLRSQNLTLAARFYEALGLVFLLHAHGSGPQHLASSEMDGQVFEIYPSREGDLSTGGVRLGFAVVSVDETYAALLSAGGIPLSPPQNSIWGRRAVVADPDGHKIEITEN